MLRKWSSDLISILNRFEPELAIPLQRCITSRFDYFETLLHICYAADKSSRSCALLIKEGCVWDSEPLVRSVMEGTVKLLYLTHGSEHERREKFEEYIEALPKITSLKRSERVVKILAAAGDASDLLIRPLKDVVISEQEDNEIRTKYPRAARKLLEHRWAFFEIIESLIRADPRHKPLLHLFYGYGASSHTLHADSDGVGIRFERASRSEIRRDSVNLAHGGRVVSDLAALVGLRLKAVLEVTGSKKNALKELERITQPLEEEINRVQKDWEEIEYPVE